MEGNDDEYNGFVPPDVEEAEKMGLSAGEIAYLRELRELKEKEKKTEEEIEKLKGDDE